MARNIKPTVYFFCEWKTEEKYFIQLSRILNNTSFKIKTFDLEWGKKILDNPDKIRKLIINTLKHDKNSLTTQKVFVIFDLDIFDTIKLQNTQSILKDFELIVSNMTFEYWILSHFEKYDLSGWKDKYLWKLSKHLPNLSNEKFTWRTDYDWLSNEKIEIAIKHVKEVNSLSSWNLKNRDPYSEVYKIIEFLNNN